MIEFFISDHCKNETPRYKPRSQTTLWKGKSCDEKFRTSSIALDQSACQTRLTADTGRSPGFPARCAALLQHEDWFIFFFLIIFPIYKGAYCNCWSGFRTSKSSYWIVHMTHHQTPARRCSCVIHTATIAPHQRMTVSSPGLSQTPWVTMWGDPRLQHLPQVCQTCPPQTHSSAEHLGSTSRSLKCFDAKYLRGVLVCEPICLVQSNSMP